MLAILHVEEGDVVWMLSVGMKPGRRVGLTWYKRVHAVYGYKFFGERIWDALVVNSRTWDSADGFACFGDSAYDLVESFSCDTPP